jgi:hypothetical protein
VHYVDCYAMVLLFFLFLFSSYIYNAWVAQSASLDTKVKGHSKFRLDPGGIEDVREYCLAYFHSQMGRGGGIQSGSNMSITYKP